MKTVRLLGSFLAGPTRAIGEGFLAFFRFTEEDANILLSAHGFRAAEIERLDKSVSDVRSVRLVTSEQPVAAMAESSSPDDIERPFPRPSSHLRIIRMTATIAAASAVAMAVFMAGRMFPDGRRNAAARLAAVSPAP